MLDILECDQGTDEWLRARAGIPTASMFGTVMAKGRGGGISKGRQTYMYKLAGERVTDEPMESYSNGNMERGTLLEPDARNAYILMTGMDVHELGFCRNHGTGASPDGLIGEDGLIEIKSRLPHIQIVTLLDGKVPTDNLPQIQGQLWVIEKEWCDYVSYCPGLPLFIKRVNRDEKYIANLSREVAQFNEELNELENKIRSML